MNKTKEIMSDVGLFILTALSGASYYFMEFCNMRGVTHARDFCDIFDESLFKPLIHVHQILLLVILVDVVVIVSVQKSLFTRRARIAIAAVLALLVLGVAGLLLL